MAQGLYSFKRGKTLFERREHSDAPEQDESETIRLGVTGERSMGMTIGEGYRGSRILVAGSEQHETREQLREQLKKQ